MKINFDILVSNIKETILKNTITLKLKESFIKNDTKKSSWLENNVNWFFRKLKLSDNTEVENIMPKWSVYYVDFWINIWSEINGNRPALIFKATKFSYWRDIIVIPFTSFYENKSTDKFDINISKDIFEWLKNDSILKTRHLKSISKKRIWKFIWFIEDKEIRENIAKKINMMIWD